MWSRMFTVLALGMIDMKRLEGSVDAVIETETCKRFNMHHTGHWMGMDVHDVGEALMREGRGG